MIKDKKYAEALQLVPTNTTNAQTLLLRAQLLLDLKRPQDCITELISFVLANTTVGSALIPLVFRLASNYKLLESEAFKQLVGKLVSTQTTSIDVRFIESLISVG